MYDPKQTAAHKAAAKLRMRGQTSMTLLGAVNAAGLLVVLILKGQGRNYLGKRRKRIGNGGDDVI